MKKSVLIAEHMNISDAHSKEAPFISAIQIVRSLSCRGKSISRGDYEPLAGQTPAIIVRTIQAFQRLMIEFPSGNIPMHG